MDDDTCFHQVSVIDEDARYEFEADDWQVNEHGGLEIIHKRKLVATFAPGWRAAFATRQEFTGPAQ